MGRDELYAFQAGNTTVPHSSISNHSTTNGSLGVSGHPLGVDGTRTLCSETEGRIFALFPPRPAPVSAPLAPPSDKSSFPRKHGTNKNIETRVLSTLAQQIESTSACPCRFLLASKKLRLNFEEKKKAGS